MPGSAPDLSSDRTKPASLAAFSPSPESYERGPRRDLGWLLFRADLYRRLRRRWTARVGAACLGFVALLSIAAPVLAPHDPDLPHVERAFPTEARFERRFPFGTDALGRCELSRLLYGGRVSLAISAAATALLVLIGTGVGVAAGYVGGWVDAVLMRLVDALMSFPFLLVVMAVNRAVTRPGVWVLLLVLGLLGWTKLSRQVRAKVLLIRELDYVTAARAIGAPTRHVILRHVLPGVSMLIVALASGVAAELILAESALSYLGVGVTPPTASWGSMLREAEPYIRVAPHLTYLPGAAILITVIGLNLVGNGLRDALDSRG